MLLQSCVYTYNNIRAHNSVLFHICVHVHVHVHTHVDRIVLIVFMFLYLHVHMYMVSDFGNRPRRLYVVVNPASAEGNALHVWSRVERLFQLTHITTELMC